MEPELGGGGGLAGALQAGHEDHAGLTGLASCRQRRIGAAHRFHQLIMHQLDEFLVRADASHHLGSDRLAPDLLHEVLHHRQAHIGLQQGAAHLLEGPLHIGFGDGGLAPQPLDRVLKPLG